MKLGIYENHLGVQIRVIQPIYNIGPYQSLGGLYAAESVQPTSWGATVHWIVTEQALKDAGHKLIESEDSSYEACGKGKCADAAGHEGECAY